MFNHIPLFYLFRFAVSTTSHCFPGDTLYTHHLSNMNFDPLVPRLTRRRQNVPLAVKMMMTVVSVAAADKSTFAGLDENPTMQAALEDMQARNTGVFT